MSIEQTTINTIRTLAMDAIQQANSGHPGAPMALAPVAYQLWKDQLRFDPAQPLWPNRDRYILSCGHASMLLYPLLHLAGVKQCDAAGNVTQEEAVSLEAIRNFRQWKSRTPGHPEHGSTSGVETTTGPLGQGCGNGVGMAIASRWLAAKYNQPGFDLFDYDVYVQCSDGDLMEGITAEAASLAGHLKLSNLCWVYDDNRITIEGGTSLAFTDDTAKRFEGMGWNVLQVADANDLAALQTAYAQFKTTKDKPTLIIVRSTIGCGAPNKQNTAGIHGSPLGEEEIQLTKEAYGWPKDKKFLVPPETREHFQSAMKAHGGKLRTEWDTLYAEYKTKHADLAAELEAMWANELPEGWDAKLEAYPADAKGTATRGSAGKALQAVAQGVPWLIGGSADLAPSTKTLLTFDGAGSFSAENHGGRNFHFGIREHAMAAAANGMALCGVRPYVATFFIFSDYLRPSMRLAALMHLPVTYVFTHDSIGVGEDGPTHQPVEQLAACRAIPNLVVLRPADANEANEAWRTAVLQKDRPVALVLTRQNLPTLCREKHGSAEGLKRGGYVLLDAQNGSPEAILMATGSEVSLALEAHEQLAKAGIQTRVVSMPSFELFEDQDTTYRDTVLPPGVTTRIGIEAGIRQGWDRYLGTNGSFIGLDTFGASAPFEELFKHRGLTAECVVERVKNSLGK